MDLRQVQKLLEPGVFPLILLGQPHFLLHFENLPLQRFLLGLERLVGEDIIIDPQRLAVNGGQAGADGREDRPHHILPRDHAAGDGHSHRGQNGQRHRHHQDRLDF